MLCVWQGCGRRRQDIDIWAVGVREGVQHTDSDARVRVRAWVSMTLHGFLASGIRVGVMFAGILTV